MYSVNQVNITPHTHHTHRHTALTTTQGKSHTTHRRALQRTASYLSVSPYDVHVYHIHYRHTQAFTTPSSMPYCAPSLPEGIPMLRLCPHIYALFVKQGHLRMRHQRKWLERQVLPTLYGKYCYMHCVNNGHADGEPLYCATATQAQRGTRRACKCKQTVCRQ